VAIAAGPPDSKINHRTSATESGRNRVGGFDIGRGQAPRPGLGMKDLGVKEMRLTRSSFARAGLAALAAGAVAAFAAPASADSFSFRYSTGPAYRAYGPPGWHKHAHKRNHPVRVHRYVYAPPRNVFYVPPPRVVYLPPPPPRVVYVPAPAPAPVAAVPSSPVFQTADGRYCREYQATVTVGGAPQSSYGTACLEPDGAWRIVN
jgi:hypothetical protein